MSIKEGARGHALALMFWLRMLRHRKERGRYCRDCFHYELRTDEKGWCKIKKCYVSWNSTCQQFLERARV